VQVACIDEYKEEVKKHEEAKKHKEAKKHENATKPRQGEEQLSMGTSSSTKLNQVEKAQN